MAAAWPASLPCFLFEGYAVAPQSPVLEVDHGWAVRRRQIYSDMNEAINVGLILTHDEWATFIDYYNDTLEQGSLPFDAPILIEGSMTTRESKFTGAPPAYTPVGSELVRTSATLLADPA